MYCLKVHPILTLSLVIFIFSAQAVPVTGKAERNKAGVLHAGSYDTDFTKAENLYKKFRIDFLEIKMVNQEEAQKIVTAICSADEDKRKDASAGASARAKSAVDAACSSFGTLKNDTKDAINAALESTTKAKANAGEYTKNKTKIDKYLDKLQEYSDDLAKKSKSITKMTAAIRGNNHPVIAWMMETGQAAHEDRQKRSEFFADEVDAGSAGRIDCLAVSGTKLIVVELKPCNPDAIEKGEEQLSRYVKEIRDNWTSKYMNKFKKKYAAFSAVLSAVTTISSRIDCYKICPIITEEGDFEKSYLRWEKGIFTKDNGNLQ
jgi:Restriction endonuclease fold toxin 9